MVSNFNGRRLCGARTKEIIYEYEAQETEKEFVGNHYEGADDITNVSRGNRRFGKRKVRLSR